MAEKFVLDDQIKDVFGEALSYYLTIAHEYYDENPGWFDRDMYDILMDFVNGKTWED